MLSSKWPLTVLLVELSEQLRARQFDLRLVWRQRDLNQEADDLTNGKFEAFDPSLRVPIVPADLPWVVLDAIMKDSQELYMKIVAERELAKASGVPLRKFGYKKIKASLRLRTKNPW
jgi:hypothetical protein